MKLFYSIFIHSSDSPVLWVRIDPEVTWLRQVTFEQPDYMWQYQLRHERDVTAQSEVCNYIVRGGAWLSLMAESCVRGNIGLAI